MLGGLRMFCVKCGAELPAGSKFCNSCGARVESDFEVPESVETKKKPAIKSNKKVLAIAGGAVLAVLLIVGIVLGIKDSASRAAKKKAAAKTVVIDQNWTKKTGNIVVRIEGMPVAICTKNTFGAIVYGSSIERKYYEKNVVEAACKVFEKEYVDDCVNDSASVSYGVVFDESPNFAKYSLEVAMSPKESEMKQSILDAYEGRDYKDYGFEFIWNCEGNNAAAKDKIKKVMKSAEEKEWKFEYADVYNWGKAPSVNKRIVKFQAKNSLGNTFEVYYKVNFLKGSSSVESIDKIKDSPKEVVWINNYDSNKKNIMSNVGKIAMK